MPRALGDWLERNGRFRNFPAYAILAVPYLLLFRRFKCRAAAMLLLAVFGSVLEALQYFLPSRWCEWQDAALSVAGLSAAWLVYEVAYWAIRQRANAIASRSYKTVTAARRLRASISRAKQEGPRMTR
jgi:VanZ family protein